MTTTSETTQLPPIVELPPSYVIPVVLVLSSIPLFLILKWVALPVSLFGLFLAIQTATIRLQFTPTDLDIYRSGKMIRRFPYREWTNWEIFWSPIPILFYFREVNSIHFLPMLFNAGMLRSCLEEKITINR